MATPEIATPRRSATDRVRGLIGWVCVGLAVAAFYSFFAPVVDWPVLAWYRPLLPPILVETAGAQYLLDASALFSAVAASIAALWVR